jgi:exopolyphosphatase / guanosine-5'-triphosphate,3'-diphosphate pyrophosphatase
VRTAVVDIGTNSTRLLIADVVEDRVTDELVRRTAVTRLGIGVDANGSLTHEAMERVYATLDEYHALIGRNAVDGSIAVLTSAVRDAANGARFATEVFERYGLVPRILSGEEEARLTFLGATSERDPADRTPMLVIDIGGGSTELVIGDGHEPSFHVSNQAGVVRQTERHIHADPPGADELDAVARDVRAIFEHGVPADRRSGVGHAIAVAGTATSLAAIAQTLEPYDPDRVQGYVLGRGRCARILADLARLPLEQRRRVPGLHPDRAPTIIAGVIILLESLRLFALDEVEVSEHDILRGAALELAAGR